MEKKKHKADGIAGCYNCRLNLRAALHIYKSVSASLLPLPQLTQHMMSRPTLTDVLVRSTSDSQIIFEAVAQKLLPLITKRLTPIERRDLIRPGSVFVWEERGPESGSSGVSWRGPPFFFRMLKMFSVQARIERWTDGEISARLYDLAHDV